MTRLRRSWGSVSKPHPGGSVNYGHPLARDLIGAVPFAEGAGHPRDFAQNLILGSGVRTYPTSGWANTPMGPGILFTPSGTGEALKLGLPGVIQFLDGASFIGWIMYTGGTSSTTQFLLNAGGGNSQFQLFSWLTGNGVFAAWDPNAAPFDQANAGGAIGYPSDRNVHMIAFVHRPGGNGAGRLFWDGRLVATGVTASNNNGVPAGDIYIGNAAGGTEPANGVITQVLVYRRALADAEIAWLWAEPYVWSMPPTPALFTAGVALASSSAIKTVDGLAKASVKTVDGLAIASVKTVDGLA